MKIKEVVVEGGIPAARVGKGCGWTSRRRGRLPYILIDEYWGTSNSNNSRPLDPDPDKGVCLCGAN